MKFISALQTLKDGLDFCTKYLRDNPDCSLENKLTKRQQIEEHELAIRVLKEYKINGKV